ncbi:hypothetical protein [endosymbiont GvMRE of Glomus versiforme]|uniref:hypothetical protein n=1 Tax=endosymbiont GvMRE of Glomus versiforme TaxID=2039283 RepID=UPI000EC56EB2|nr:hypothetical protein [endosymbiont GvMRE of Glomus versiforme]RHZ35986.1 hypothetical protein GvMRE_Ic3g56 [endosymbiont GvMRE of Glomus versiforme]
MITKKLVSKSDKISRFYKINATIKEIKRSELQISYHYQKRNKEYLKGCKKRRVKPDKNRLFNNKVICDMVQQLHEKELESRGTHPKKKHWKYYAYEPVIDKRSNLTYKIIIFLDDYEPNFVGFINLLYRDKKEKKTN